MFLNWIIIFSGCVDYSSSDQSSDFCFIGGDTGSSGSPETRRSHSYDNTLLKWVNQFEFLFDEMTETWIMFVTVSLFVW